MVGIEGTALPVAIFPVFLLAMGDLFGAVEVETQGAAFHFHV